MRGKGNLVNDLIIPTSLFVTAGLFSWAIRGQSGFGSIPGCVFAGVLWALIWFYLSKEKSEIKSRRYSSGWVIFALIFGIGISGMQGWGQWTAWMRGEFVVNDSPYSTLPIEPGLGYLWWFLVALHWSGIGAVLLAWTGSKNPLSKKDWCIRLAFGGVGFLIFALLYQFIPQLFLPYYDLLNGYNPGDCSHCIEILDDNRQVLYFLGLLLGFLAYEIYRKDWSNVKLIVIVSVVTGLLWMPLQYIWMILVPDILLPGVAFNWWRCWESTSGGAIGLSLGIAYFVCNRRLELNDRDARSQPYSKYRNLEKLMGIEFALAFGFGWNVIQGIKGWLHIFLPSVPELDYSLLGWAVPIVVLFGAMLVVSIYTTMQNPFKLEDGRDNAAHFWMLFIIIYITHREIGLQVTYSYPVNTFSEIAFFVYYVILACIDLILILIWKKRTIGLDRITQNNEISAQNK